MKTIKELEALFNIVRVNHVKKIAKMRGWNLEGICDRDLLEIYACLEIKEKFQEKLDKETKLWYN